jgi:curli biogenesis system outer membrane secretion channel CsgG
MNRSIALIVCIAALASLAGCASASKSVAAPAQAAAPREYDRSEYTSPEEREIFVSTPQESQARKDTRESELSPSLVTHRKAKQLFPQGYPQH